MRDIDYIRKINSYLERAYVPYSKFPVAALVIADNDKEYIGVNVENAAYPLCLCAERNAITTAVSDGMKKIKKIYITADVEEPISPCGSCRQVISEFSSENTIIILGNKNNEKMKHYYVGDILPYSFSSNDL